MLNRPLKVATRKSALALTQTNLAVKTIYNGKYELVSMTTEGDRRLDKTLASFGGKGVFIKELEVALLEGRADIAIHSLKDMPSEVLPEFNLAAVLEREDPRDAFIAKGGALGKHFMELPAGAKVGTGSIRRVVQLKALRPDLEYVSIRGNIQTRLSKLAELDGVILAAAGLKRMGLANEVTEYFSTQKILPASGQGILAVETLKNPLKNFDEDFEKIKQILESKNHQKTYAVAVAEMSYLKALEAGCQFPVASFAEWDDDFKNLKIRGIYFDESSNQLLKVEENAAIDYENTNYSDLVQLSKKLGESLAQRIKDLLQKM